MVRIVAAPFPLPARRLPDRRRDRDPHGQRRCLLTRTPAPGRPPARPYAQPRTAARVALDHRGGVAPIRPANSGPPSRRLPLRLLAVREVLCRPHRDHPARAHSPAAPVAVPRRRAQRDRGLRVRGRPRAPGRLPRDREHSGDLHTWVLCALSQGTTATRPFVFSDDLPWRREHLVLDTPLTFVPDETPDRPEEHLALLSRCRQFILAHSTFGWWGAWLSTSRDKVVIGPSRWIQIWRDHSDLLPPEWLRVETDRV